MKYIQKTLKNFRSKFLDGKEMQQPMVLGTMVGAPTDLPKFWEGFNDPDGIYPKIEDSMVGVGESDINA